MATQRSLYDVLNVAPNAEPVVIEAAYRALMKKYHPDQSSGEREASPSSAADINRAYEILRDPSRRADYDHRQWTRHQAVRLAELQKVAPAPHRPRRAFGWGGWFVALLLGIALFVIVQGRNGVVAPVTGANLAEVSDAEPDRRSQPVRIEPSFIRASTGPNEVEREILKREAAEAKEAAAEREAAEEEAKAIAEADEAATDLSIVAPRPITRERSSQPRQKPKAPPVRQPGESEEDFLQRQGYLY